MKEFIKKCLLLLVLIVFAVYLIPAIQYGHWENSIFLLELFFVSILIRVVQLLTSKIKSDWYILELLFEFTIVVFIVGTAGLFFGWFALGRLWIVICYVTPVYIVGYFLDLSRTRKDVDFINEKIKQRKAEIGKEKPNESNSD